MKVILIKVLVLPITLLIYLTSCIEETDESWNIGSSKELIAIVTSSYTELRFETYQISDHHTGDYKNFDSETIYGYPIISGPQRMAPKDQKVLFSTIKRKSTYLENEIPKDCFFQPGVVFRFKNKKRLVDLLVCFKCSELRYYLDGEIIWQTSFRSKELQQLVKKLFP